MPLDIAELLRRGGELTPAEEKQLLQEWQESKLAGLRDATSARTLDQPVKVLPRLGAPPKIATGYFTQQKFIVGKTPAEMEAVLGIFGKLAPGAFILQFDRPLRENDFEAKAYTYLPDGKPWVPDPAEKVYLPGKGAPQWRLTHPVAAECIAVVAPGQAYVIHRGR